MYPTIMIYCDHSTLWVFGISGMECRWNGLLEWNTGMDWDKIFVLALNLKHYKDQVDRHYTINYASMMLGTADHIGLTSISYNP